MKARCRQNFSLLIRIAPLLIIFLITGSIFAIPSLQQPEYGQLTVNEIYNYLQQYGGEGKAMGGDEGGGTTEPEIVQLARGLRYDPDLMYKFVHDSIEHIPYLFAKKGAYGTLMDRSGNSFDQSMLLVALLKQAGFNPVYVVGFIELTPNQMIDWLGIPDGSDVATIEGCCNGMAVSYNAGTEYFEVFHVWVKVTIDYGEGSKDYVFDPSLKSHAYNPGIDLPAVIENADIVGYNQSNFLTSVGGVVESDYVHSLSKSNLAAKLLEYSGNFKNYIQTNFLDATLDDIIGGPTIIPVPEEQIPHYEMSLPYEAASLFTYNENEFNVLKATISIEHRGINEELYTADIYGKTLTVFYGNDDKPRLKLNGVLVGDNSVGIVTPPPGHMT